LLATSALVYTSHYYFVLRIEFYRYPYALLKFCDYRRRGTYVNNVNALGNGNQHVNKLNDFNILYANADSLPNNVDELKSRLQDSDRSIDIIGITEV
jgi:hypothetical protein